MMDSMNYCICASGNLGLIVLRHLTASQLSIKCLLTDAKSREIIEYCIRNKIPCFVGNPRNRKAMEWLDDKGIRFDNILSINYLFILETEIIQRARKYAINFHGSLLPRYRGRTPHVWAIINGESEAGITAHLMNDLCDDGDIVQQVIVPIEAEDTGAILLEKYGRLYPQIVCEVVSLIESNRVSTIKQNKLKATYYGKRTPDDGAINWEWQKERIRNWVRAQAKPYPGAFTYINGHKVTVHKISYSDYGYYDTTPNGMVLCVLDGHPIVKTPNGAIILNDFESTETIDEGQILKTD